MSAAPVSSPRTGVTAPRGFLAAGVHAGIKRPPHPDLALIVSEREGPVAAVLTTNRFPAASIQLNRRHLRRGRARAVVVNSGNANAATGAAGMRDAVETADLVAAGLQVPRAAVLVGSTGVIGQPLPMEAVRRGIPRLLARLRPSGGADAARAILTTDTKAKEVVRQARIGGRLITIGGMAKGAGMIHPEMATMLAYLTTDAVVTRPGLQRALRLAVDESFNCISIDGDGSTNDTVLCLANGLAANRTLRPGTAPWRAFTALLLDACRDLALQLCRDGEGVTKVVEILVTGARSERDARLVARAVGTSLLVKTALFGEDANWGRIVAAAGRAGAQLDPGRLRIRFDDVPILRRGGTLGRQAERAVARVVRRREFTIALDLGLGRGRARLWTTDLSYEYIRINASYRS